MIINQHEEIARQRVAERIRAAEIRARGIDPDRTDNGPRHQVATVLRRMADWVEPPARRRTTLSFSGR
jgi:hypothetical protein